jgi:5-methyltetrahydropteroyltriglutamate--homocysteine methyltransferase
MRAAVHEAVQRQVAAGIDVVSDGEMGKPGFAHYVKDRLSGFQGQAAPRPFAPRDLLDFPEVARRLFVSDGKELPRPLMPSNDGPISYFGWDLLAADLDTFSAEVENHSVAEAFLPAVSPGCVAMLMVTTHYRSRRDFLYALADALREEYRKSLRLR